MKKDEIVEQLKKFADVHWDRLSKKDLETIYDALNDIESLKKIVDVKDIASKLIKRKGEEIAEKFADRLLERWLL